ncbi:MAG TPA: hypothetical protein VMY42_20840 [Thermoguttaceae bacterium]|nr:hypothetical protein [Thermoguttaceae bacterium]
MAKRRQKKQHEKKSHSDPSFFKKYRFEISVGVFLALGFFLVIERMQIKSTLLAGFTWLVRAVHNSLAGLGNGISSVFTDFETSDIVGAVLILVALGMVAHRIRARVLANHPDLQEDCPKCGGNLDRIRCDPAHRLLGTLLRVRIRHYSCRNCASKTSAWVRKSERKWWKEES